MSLAATYIELGRFEAAERALRRVPEILEGHVGTDHPDLAHARRQLAFAHLLRCDYAEAEAEMRAALAMFERRGEPSRDVAEARHELATILVRSNRIEDARALEEAALAHWSGDPDRLRASAVRVGLAWIDLQTGYAARARDVFAEELEVRERLARSDPSLQTEALAGLGRSLALLQRNDEAVATLSRALELYDAQRGEGRLPMRMFVAQWLADATSDHARARALRDQARDHWRRCGDARLVAALDE
jgi:tetratricopeptide (TPR) repeat protein